MKRRDALKMLAMAVVAPFVPKMGQAKPKHSFVGKGNAKSTGPCAVCNESFPSHLSEMEQLKRQLDLLHLQFPDVVILSIAGQTIFPTYSPNGCPTNTCLLCLYAGQPSVLDGGEICRTGKVPHEHRAAMILREDEKRHPYAIVEWTPEGVADARVCITTAAIKLQEWAEKTGHLFGIPYYSVTQEYTGTLMNLERS